MTTYPTFANKKIPSDAGIGLRFPHMAQIAQETPDIAWLEVHSENFFSNGGLSHTQLEDIRQNYPLSLHGVALSLGSWSEPDKQHLDALKALCKRYNPSLISEHISWNITDGVYLNDLIPIPYTEEALNTLARNIDITQNELGRQILMENPSAYLKYTCPQQMSEGDFIKALCEKSGCGLLLDINNIYVSAQNLNKDAEKELLSMPLNFVQEIHLAGHSQKQVEGQTLRIDDHGSQVCDDVWHLFETFLKHAGAAPTLIEWDTDIPSLETLLAEANKAQTYIQQAKVNSNSHSSNLQNEEVA